MAWYRAGTVAVSSGSNVVTGTGTQWLNNVRVGDAVVLGSPPQWYEVANVASNTSIGLVTNYTGTSGSGQAYFIAPTQGWIKELADRAAAVIATYASIEQAVDDLESITTLISQADAQNGTRTDTQGWSSLRVRQAANAAITARAGTSANFGTAATANVTTSTTDATTGRLLKVGDFGVGGLGPSLADANSLLASGFYSGIGPGTLNFPGSSSYEPFIATRRSRNSAIQWNIHFSQVGGLPELYVRRTDDSGANWFESKVFTSGNQIDIGATSSSARAAIDSSVLPSYTVATVPNAAANKYKGIYVTNAAAPGPRPFWSNGTEWLDSQNNPLA